MNKWLLFETMERKGYTQQKLAKELGICKTSLSLKMNGVRDFKSSEIIKICQILEIKDETAKSQIFLI